MSLRTDTTIRSPPKLKTKNKGKKLLPLSVLIRQGDWAKRLNFLNFLIGHW